MANAGRYVLLCLGAMTLSLPPARSAAPGDDLAAQKAGAVKTAGTLPAAVEPVIVLDKPLTAPDPAAFAARLTALLGVTVRLPKTLPGTLSLPAQRSTARALLADVQHQACAAAHAQGAWHRVFVFAPPPKPGAPAAPGVPLFRSAGRITLARENAAFADLARAAAGAAGCEVEVPETVAGRYSLQAAGLPVEQALSVLAARAGLAMTPALVFTFFDAGAAHDVRLAEDEAHEEATQEDAVALDVSQQDQLLLRQAASVNMALGSDPLSPDFDWDSIDARHWLGLGLTPAVGARLREAADQARANQTLVEALTAEEQETLRQADPPTAHPEGAGSQGSPAAP